MTVDDAGGEEAESTGVNDSGFSAGGTLRSNPRLFAEEMMGGSSSGSAATFKSISKPFLEFVGANSTPSEPLSMRMNTRKKDWKEKDLILR
jgi:hypothetical protein